MNNKVQVVSAYVPLTVQNMEKSAFKALGARLVAAASGRIKVFEDFPFENCWLAREAPPMVAANPRSLDRFATEDEHVRSNIIQHSPVQWVSQAAAEAPDVDVFIWMGYSLLKQGDFTGKRIQEHHVSAFLDIVEKYPFDDIPFPGITWPSAVDAHGNNWRFCGSVVIMPRKFLAQIERSYKAKCRQFIRCFECVPLDLAIWPAVERDSGLPWRWYQSEYDYTQLTNFPG